MTGPSQRSVQDGEYVLGHTAFDEERTRLGHLAAWADPITIRHFETVAVGQGWKCLEVGAGDGSMARWLAHRIGPRGSVVATDINTRLLKEMPSNCEVRTHDILNDDIEEAVHNLVHCRLVLQHLVDPPTALRKMAASLAPGGWLIVEEMDIGFLHHAGHPDSERVTAFLRAAFSDLPPADSYFGRKLPGLFLGLGLEAIGYDSTTMISTPGEPDYELWRMTTRAVSPIFLARGASQEMYDLTLEVLNDPAGVLIASTLFSAWGRQP